MHINPTNTPIATTVHAPNSLNLLVFNVYSSSLPNLSQSFRPNLSRLRYEPSPFSGISIRVEGFCRPQNFLILGTECSSFFLYVFDMEKSVTYYIILSTTFL